MVDPYEGDRDAESDEVRKGGEGWVGVGGGGGGGGEGGESVAKYVWSDRNHHYSTLMGRKIRSRGSVWR